MSISCLYVCPLLELFFIKQRGICGLVWILRPVAIFSDENVVEKKFYTNFGGGGGGRFAFALNSRSLSFIFSLLHFAHLVQWQPCVNDSHWIAQLVLLDSHRPQLSNFLDRGVKLLYRSLWVGLQTGDSNITPNYKKRSADSSAQRSSLEYCQSPLWFQAFINLFTATRNALFFPCLPLLCSKPFSLSHCSILFSSWRSLSFQQFPFLSPISPFISWRDEQKNN